MFLSAGWISQKHVQILLHPKNYIYKYLALIKRSNQLICDTIDYFVLQNLKYNMTAFVRLSLQLLSNKAV